MRNTLKSARKLTCRQVWRHISAYMDGEVAAALRKKLDAHFAICPACAALRDGTRNVIGLLADERTFSMPVGFSERLRQRLAKQARPR